MKQAFYKMLFVVFFVGVVTIITGTPQSNACDKKMIRQTVKSIKPKPASLIQDDFLLPSLFQL
jgi:hypothetical protein